MDNNEAINKCKNCGFTGALSYFNNCGDAYHSHRITLKHMAHEVVHLLTHFDKGFAYTLKNLVKRPGFMQQEYIEGKRKLYQKPFSMFFLCSTITALGLYWISRLANDTQNADDTAEVHFYHNYFVLSQMCLVPVYALINKVAYYNTKYNYAEFLVILLYNTSLLFLFILLSNTVKLIIGDVETRYIELFFVLVYNLFTYLNFFNELNKWVVCIKVILTSAICFTLSAYFTQTFIQLFLQ